MQLNKEQTCAAHYKGPAKHLLILAGAGTGKTRTIIARVIHLVQSGVPAQRILLLTFTRRAAKEMITRLSTELGPVADQITAGTFHHFCLQVMRRVPKAFGVDNRTVIDRDDQVSLVQLIRGELVDKKIKKDFPRAATLMNYISYAKNSCQALQDYLETYTELSDDFLEKVIAIAQQYELRKAERNYLDYDDILHLFVKGLEQHPQLKEQVSTLFQHILVDEMQDTNPLQWQLLQHLSKAHLFCVGDDAQSIYAFRGADFKNVHDFKNRLPDSDILKLEENYRSFQPVLDLANWLLNQSSIDYDKHLSAHRGQGLKPKVIDFESKQDEAQWIAQDLMARHEGGTPWSQHMILVRTAWAAKQLEGALIDQGVPYRFIGGTSLLEAAHVKDILSGARAAISKTDELAWIRYLTCWPRIGDATAAKIIDKMRLSDPDEDLLDTLKQALPNRDDVHKGIELVKQQGSEPALALTAITEHMSTMLEKRYDRWESRRGDLRLLADLAEKHRDLRQFIETYTLDPITNSQAEQTDQDDLVTIITVHSSKGTEAPVCYCLGVQPGMYPHMRSLGDEDAEEEERRILYVAFTRAQDELIITRSGDSDRTVFHGGSVTQAVGSPYFLEYLPNELVEYEHYGYDLAQSHSSVFDELLDFDF